MRAEIIEYYQQLGEATRLQESAGGRLEYLRTWDVLSRVLPPVPAAVLDVGGATGVYAGPLARAGYRVHVVDPVPEHVAAAAALPGVTAQRGEARSLDAADGSYDAVLLFGPLYHLLDRADRVAAWREASRVVRPAGVVVGATISRFAALLDAFARGSQSDPLLRSLVGACLVNGEHRPPPGTPYFTTAYFQHPADIAGEVADAGLAVERTVGVEGPLWMMMTRLDAVLAYEPDTALTLDLLRAIEEEPSLLGASAHLLTVATHPR